MKEFGDFNLLKLESNLTIGVNPKIKNLNRFVGWAKTEYSIQSITINKQISEALIGKPNAILSKEIVDCLSRKIDEITEKPILLSDIEILFEPGFELDPLTIFKQVSRNSSLLVMWPGDFTNNTLSYASPEHAHYRTWVNPGVDIIQI